MTATKKGWIIGITLIVAMTVMLLIVIHPITAVQWIVFFCTAGAVDSWSLAIMIQWAREGARHDADQ